MADLAFRLRTLQEQNNWTVADMSERTGIPKRTLDKYLLRQGASLPGFEALCDLSRGLGVSLDWLVFGSDAASEPMALFTERAAYEVTKMFLDTLIRLQVEGRPMVVSSEEVGGVTPLEMAADLGMRAGEYVQKMVGDGTTRADLLTWRAAIKERAGEALQDRWNRLYSGKKQSIS